MLIAEVPGQLMMSMEMGRVIVGLCSLMIVCCDGVLIIFLKFAEEVQLFGFKQLTDSFLFVF